jgi:ABC-2 type transport system ATP-binding protein
VLTLNHVRKAYGDRVAVDDVCLEVRPGEVLGLLGPNGAGKSTTVSLAVGLLEPDAGTIDVGGLGPPTRPEVRRKLGVAPQSLAIYEDLTAEENLRFFARIFGLRGATLRARIENALALAGLADRRRDRASTFSGGMKRRLNIAAALVHEPALVLLDEPTVGVDPQSRNAILERISALRDAGLTVIYTTADAWRSTPSRHWWPGMAVIRCWSPRRQPGRTARRRPIPSGPWPGSPKAPRCWTSTSNAPRWSRSSCA